MKNQILALALTLFSPAASFAAVPTVTCSCEFDYDGNSGRAIPLTGKAGVKIAAASIQTREGQVCTVVLNEDPTGSVTVTARLLQADMSSDEMTAANPGLSEALSMSRSFPFISKPFMMRVTGSTSGEESEFFSVNCRPDSQKKN